MNNILLFGGGLDSSSLLVYLNIVEKVPNLELIHFDYGQKARSKERESLEYFSKKYSNSVKTLSLDMSFSQATIMKGSSIGNADTNRLELRNVVFLSLAASYASSRYEKTNLWVGFHKEPPESGFLDAKPVYLSPLNDVFALSCTKKVSICAPFSDYSRARILQYGYQLDPDVLDKSYTCYEENECGKCVHCVEKDKMRRELCI